MDRMAKGVVIAVVSGGIVTVVGAGGVVASADNELAGGL